MATATKETNITITLTMNEKEAKFIRSLTKYEEIDLPPNDSLADYETRIAIFEAVSTALRKRK